jgi:hypothetical protein
MDEEILEKKPSNPVESALLFIAFLCLVASIGLSRMEVIDYLTGTQESEYNTDAKDRIREKYEKNKEINNIKSNFVKEKEKLNDFISVEGEGPKSN